jgi:probable F420-dependent oxidoreductase
MKFGVLPPYRTGVTADPAWMSRFARAAEAVGLESIYVVEHVVVPADYDARYPYSKTGRMPLPVDCPIPDPLELLAFLAGVTERLVLGTGVLVLPEHNPVILAKRLATIDVLSGGRMRLGIGVGWMKEEAEAVGIDPSTRGARTDEMIDAMRVLWRDDEPTFHGQFCSFDRAVSRPRPVQPGGVPIHVGGHSPAAARRAGTRGDGYHPLGLDGDVLVERLAQMRTAARAADRDPDAIELTLGGLLVDTDEAAVERARGAGADRLVLSTVTGDLAELEDQMQALAHRLGL